MSQFSLSERSLGNLQGVHEDLASVMREAINHTEFDFTIIDGVRAIEKQIDCCEKGVSKTYNSRHLHGFAIDFLPYSADGVNCFDKDKLSEAEISKIFSAVAEVIKGIGRDKFGDNRVEWGGDWTSFIDLPHIQLSKSLYPDRSEIIEELRNRELIE